MSKILTDENEIRRVFDRRLERENVFPSYEEVIERFKSGERFRIYLGIDPTAQSLHLGHSIPLFFLKGILSLGHQPVVLFGTFTAKIGDPTGKDTARRSLSDEEVQKNMKNYLSQVQKILPAGSFESEYNGSWLSKLTFEDLIKLSSCFTVQQMLARDMFKERIKKERPIGLHEFLYPLMQGYDSVAMKIDGEVGGNDQTFNMLIGRELEKELIGKDKMVLATRLLVSTKTGKKMSKTDGELINLDDNPEDMFGKVMASISDDMIADTFMLCTEKDAEWVKKREKEVQEGENPKIFKEELGYELVRIYYDEGAAEKARKYFKETFSEGIIPEDTKESPPKENILETIIASGIVESKSELKRLLEQGAVRINGQIIREWKAVVKRGDIIKVGPRKFIKIS